MFDVLCFHSIERQRSLDVWCGLDWVGLCSQRLFSSPDLFITYCVVVFLFASSIPGASLGRTIGLILGETSAEFDLSSTFTLTGTEFLERGYVHGLQWLAGCGLWNYSRQLLSIYAYPGVVLEY